MSDALTIRSSTKAASRAVTALSTLRFETDRFRCRLAPKLVSNQLGSYRQASLPNDGLLQKPSRISCRPIALGSNRELLRA